MIFEELTGKIIACSLDVHHELGPGLLEEVYESALCVELFERGLQFERQMRLPVIYKGREIGLYRIDLLVENTSTPHFSPKELKESSAPSCCLHFFPPHFRSAPFRFSGVCFSPLAFFRFLGFSDFRRVSVAKIGFKFLWF
jgi:hypothetical protein